MSFHVVVLAGGSGTRLWPLSRGAVPKHLLPLGPNGQTLLRATLERVLPLEATVWVATVAEQAERCADELAAAGGDPNRVIAEPAARGTGPALGLAMSTIAREDAKAVCCSVHADHHVGDAQGYRAALWAGAGWALATQGLATVGVPPTHPATGLGYVGVGSQRDPQEWRSPVAGLEQQDAARHLAAHAATGFVEKPPPAEAERMVARGDYLWNTGLFAWQASVFLSQLEAASPQIAEATRGIATARTHNEAAAALDAYLSLPNTPVEPLVLERAPVLTVVRGPFSWSDLGSWSDLRVAVAETASPDADGNFLRGDALAAGARDCLVEARGGRLVAVVGAQGLVVVDVGDAVLVIDPSASQRVKEVVERLRDEGRNDLL